MGFTIKKFKVVFLLLILVYLLSGCISLRTSSPISSIEVDGTMLKENYYVDTFELSSIHIIVRFVNETVESIPITKTMLSSEHQALLSNEGEHEITITYKSKTTTMALSMIDRSITHTISFESNGGSSVESITQCYKTEVLKPSNPIKDNYRFINWYTDSNLTNKYTFTTMPAENLILYAKWGIIYDFFTIDVLDYFYYGKYPQTVVSDNSLISSLNALTSTNANGYYEYEGEEYAKVTATPYGSNCKFTNGSSIITNQTYYFKVEPILWRVLAEEDSHYTLLSEYIIDKQVFHTSSSIQYISGEAQYPNNYEHSSIRDWLNNTFYNKAFSVSEKDIILTSLVDNSVSTTGNSQENPYACDNTNDKVFLLSHQEAESTTYGFAWGINKRMLRTTIATDYARALGVLTTFLTGYEGNGYWWLRSPNYNDYRYTDVVNADGIIGPISYTDLSAVGTRPALKIN